MKAITVGSATIDIITTIADTDIEQMTLHNSTSSFLLMEPGTKVDATSVLTQTGGGAINAAVSFARQGFNCATLVKVGEDLNARKLRERLLEEKISEDLVGTCDDHETAVSVLIMSHDRNAAIFTHRGANGYLSDEDINADKFEGADLVYVTNLSNDSANLFPDIVKRAKEAGAFVAINPGIRQMTWKTDPLLDSLKYVDLFSCNRLEAAELVPALVDRTGWSERKQMHFTQDEATLRTDGFKISMREYFERMHSLGPKFVAATDGSNGAYLSTGKDFHFQPVIKTNVVGTAGAGDAFASTLTAALINRTNPQEALLFASLNAASVVSFVDTQTGLLSLEQLKERASKHQKANV